MKKSFKTQNFQKKTILGEGTYGKCYLVNHILENQLYVLKQIEVAGMNNGEIDETMKQARILEALDHPNIVKCIEAFIQNSTLNILMEYADGGDLSKKIKNTKGSYFSQNQILNWFTQICLAIKHVHDRKIIHRDIKSQNIFLTSENLVKLGDFGIARPLLLTRQKSKTVVGTPYYMSPEICENKEYSLKTDIWSLGVILFEMCSLKPPFDANSLPALALKISRGEYGAIPSHYSKELKKLITQLLQVDSAKRPTIHQVLKCSLLKSRIDTFLPQGIRERQFSHTTLHSQNVFQRDDVKKDISKLVNQQPQINSIISPKSAGNQALFFPSQTPQSKGNQPGKNKQSQSNNKQKNPFEKKKKNELRKRQISEPSLTPKSNDKKLKGNASLTNLQKKKSDKEKINFFKKKKIPQDYQSQLSQIKQFRDCVIQMHGHLSADPEWREQKGQKPEKMINNFIQEEEQECEQNYSSYTSSDQSQIQQGAKNSTLGKDSTKLSHTLEKILIQTLGEKQLSKNYCKMEQEFGFILKKDKENIPQNSEKNLMITNEGLLSLLYGLNNFMNV